MKHQARTPASTVRSRGGLLALACLALLSFSAVAVAQSVMARSTKSKPSSQVARFYLRGTNGYKVSVLASVEGRNSPVRVVAESLEGGAEYQVPGTVTSTKIHASFGQYGDISLRFRPSGRVLHSNFSSDKECSHRAARVGTFIGTFSFRGENAYTTVAAHRIRGGVGAPTAPINHREELSLGCSNANRDSYIAPPGQVPQSFHENEPGSLEMFATATASNEATIFATVSFSLLHPNMPGAKPDFCVFAALTEETRGSIQIARAVFQGGPVSECPFDESLGSFTVSPPAPFTGTATLQRNADGSTSWTGSLSVSMLGRGPVALTGSAFKAELSR